MNKFRNKFKTRELIQALASLISNGNFLGFFRGRIYKGKTKSICLPGLNCYSCPGALGACPIGSIQAVISGSRYNFSYYVFGILLIFAIIFGRLICGFLCPFGFFQDLAYKLPSKKKKLGKKLDRKLALIKYFILAFMVVLLPALLANEFGVGKPYFCKLLCPAGVLGGAIPLIIKNKTLRSMLGLVFAWKMLILVAISVLSIFNYRPFCKYLCPLGAFYSFFNRFSFYRMEVDRTRCNSCGACEKYCKMQVDIRKNINSMDCIRCGQCKKICKQGAISSAFKF